MTLHRPIYETASDLSRQDAVAQALRGALQCDLDVSAPLSPVDYVARREGRLVGLVEVKVRASPMRRYPTYVVSLAKLATMQALAAVAGVPAIIAVGWSDAVGWARPDDVTDVTVGGRTDRSDRRDVELVGHIPISKFRVVG